MPYRSRDQLVSHVLDDDEIEQLLELWRKGLSLQAIADRFGIHKNTVRNILDRTDKGTIVDRP